MLKPGRTLIVAQGDVYSETDGVRKAVATMLMTLCVVRTPSVSLYTSPCATIRVRPGLSTRPTATSRSPWAGESRLILYSAVSPASPSPTIDSAA